MYRGDMQRRLADSLSPAKTIWMAFIMPVYAKCRNRLRGLFTLSLLLFFTASAWAQGFKIRSVETRLVDKVYQLNADVEYTLSSSVLEALKNGVPLVILLEIKVEKERSWWLNKSVGELKQGYLLLFHALSDKYIVNNLNSGAQHDFSNVDEALASLSHVEDLPILDVKLVEPAARYKVLLRTYLDLESLPAPVRPLAYLSAPWRLESDWYQWPLQR